MKIKLRTIRKEDVSIISDIHIKAFQSSLLTKLGFRVVSKYYLWQLLNENEVYPMLVENENNEILGYCFGGVFKAALVGFIMHNKFIILKSILLKPSIVFNWSNIIKIKDAIFTILLKKLLPLKHKNLENNEKIQYFGILAIAITPEFKRQGIGKLLIDDFESTAKKKGFNNLRLSVDVENLAAINFYEKLGWEKFQKNNMWDGLMVKAIH